MQQFLASSKYIDWQHPAVLAKAQALAAGSAANSRELIRRCFEFVRDDIKHCMDYQLDTLTCKASDVLVHGTGFCYAKSHLLAALLRANGVPTGLCYQRLTFTVGKPPYTLHGLNAVYLDDIGWFRIDARGNKRGVDAQFTPPIERLAFAIEVAGEEDLPGVLAEPLPAIVDVLTRYGSVKDAVKNLPDVEPTTWQAG